MIAITFALPTESSGVVYQLREKQRALRGDDQLIFGKIGNNPVAIFHTGVGRKNCEAKIDIFLQEARPQFVISSGFAGAVREDLSVGDLIFGENFSDRQSLLRAERILRHRNPRAVKLFTSTSIVDSVSERTEIARASDAAAVDMETEVIATACNAYAIPLLSLRAISDTSHQPFPALPSVLFDTERQRTNFTGLTAYLVRHPASSWRLIQFARQVARARQSLTSAIMALLPNL